MIFRFQPRRGTAAEAAANNGILLMGEKGFETDTGRWKTGDGATHWNSLPYDDEPDRIHGATPLGVNVLTAGTQAAARSAIDAAKTGDVFPDLHHDFTDDSNGSLTAIDSGGTWVLAGAVPLQVASGAVVLPDTTTVGTRASYAQKQLSTPVTFLEGDFKFTSTGSSGSTICLAAFVPSMAQIGGGTLINSPAHIVVGRTSINYGVWVDGVYTILATSTYPALSDNTVYHVEAGWDAATQTGWMRDPTGAVTQVSGSAIALQARWATCEIFYTDASANSRLAITRFAADTRKVDAQTAAPTKLSVLRNQAAPMVGTSLTNPRINIIYDTNGVPIVQFFPTASAVNRIGIYDSITGAAPTVGGIGADTNVDLRLTGQGSGRVKANDGSGTYREVANIDGAQVFTHKDLTSTTNTFPVLSASAAATDYGWIAWNFDPVACFGVTQLVGGVQYVMRVPIRFATTITNVIASVGTAGSGLTSGQCFAGLAVNGTITSTADQSTAWASTGIKTMALSAPVSVAAGDVVYVVLMANGTTRPSFLQAISNSSNPVANFNTGTYRRYVYDSTNINRTTSLSATLGTLTDGTPFWVAVS